MKRLGNNVYQVTSETSDKTYIVDLNGDVPTCTCTNWAITRNKAVGLGQPIPGCKHSRQVAADASEKTVDDLKSLLADLHGTEPRKPASTLKCPNCGNTTFGCRVGAIVLAEQIETYRELVVEDDGTITGADHWFDFQERSGVRSAPSDQFICNGCQHRWPVAPGQIPRWEPLENHPNYKDREPAK